MNTTTNGNGHSNNNHSSFSPKKFLFVSWEALSGDLAYQIQNEGHEVKVYVEAEYDKDVYEGFLERVSSYKDFIDWADVIVFDDIGFGEEAGQLRKKGKLIVGGSEYTDRLEKDREFGQAEMKKMGMLILPHWDFSDYDSALKFIEENPGRYVFKPSEFVGSASKGLLFLGKDDDGKDIYEILKSNKATLEKRVKQFQLQKFAQGVEVAVGAFFNGTDFIYPINVNFEHKKLFPGDIGPYTGEMGTLMYWSGPNTIFKTTLEKMREEIKKSGYVGYIDINCIANARGIYPLEFTCRFGYPTISVQMEGVQSQWGDFLYRIAAGENCELKTKKGFQIGICCAVPPFPFYDAEEMDIYKDLSIIFKKPSLDGIRFGDLKMSDGSWKIAGCSGYVLVVTGSGTTVNEARKQTYCRVENILLQNMFYRTDIGLKWNQDSDRLQTWGYLY
jgi:phosphoribosylamine---glycine ligase